MSLAAVFAFLIASGVCAQSEFRAPDGGVLAVLVCPRAVAPDTDEPAEAEKPKRPERRT